MLVFQNSRRQLLSSLMDQLDAANTQQDTQNKDSNPESENETQKNNNLRRAIEAADNECKKLEYWSDVKDLAEEGKAGMATDPSKGWDEKWQGLDMSGAKHPDP